MRKKVTVDVVEVVATRNRAGIDTCLSKLETRILIELRAS